MEQDRLSVSDMLPCYPTRLELGRHSVAQVLENCTKRCGHMFREKLPFSDLWTELHKVATLKRKVDLSHNFTTWIVFSPNTCMP